jgi:hypothetical protein
MRKHVVTRNEVSGGFDRAVGTLLPCRLGVKMLHSR